MARRSIIMDDFSGGLDYVSDPLNMNPSFTDYALNARITDDGSIEQMVGSSSKTDLGSGVAGHDLFYFNKIDDSQPRVVVASASKWHTIDPSQYSWAASDIRTGMTATTNTTFITHDDKLYGLDPLNDMATWDGTTLTVYAPGVDSGPPKGIILGVWNSRMWVAVAVAGEIGMQIVWSDPFDATNGFVNSTGIWNTENNLILGGGGKDSEFLVGGAPTPDGLTVFTNKSTYLIYDSADGFNTVIDADGGCISRRSIVLDGDKIIGLNEKGIFATNGRQPLEYLSDKIAPWFENIGLKDTGNVFASGVIHGGKYFLSLLPNDGSVESLNYNRLTYEMSLTTGSIMQHSGYAAKAWIVIPRMLSADTTFYYPDRCAYLLNGSSYSGASSGRNLYEAFTSTTNMGDLAYRIPFISAERGALARLHEVSIAGRGLTLKVDALSSGDLSIPSGAGTLISWVRGTWSGTSQHDRGRARISAKGGSVGAFIRLAATTLHTRQTIHDRYYYSGGGFSRVELRYTESSRRF